MPAEILPEEFRPCPRFPGYRVSRCGQRVQSCKVVRPVPGAPRGTVAVEFSDEWRDLAINRWTRKRYLYVSLRVNNKKANVGVHTLVLEAFVGPRLDGMEARHLNGDPADNRLDNLAWGTKEENAADKLRHGNVVRGERAGTAKLDAESVAEMRRLRRQGWTFYSISGWFGVEYRTIYDAVTGKTWKHIADPPPCPSSSTRSAPVSG